MYDIDSNYVHNIIPTIKGIIARQTVTGGNREYGLTLHEILNEINSVIQIYNDQPPMQANQLQQILTYQIDGVNQFDTVTRNDGTILYQNIQQDVYDQILFNYNNIYQAEPPPLPLQPLQQLQQNPTHNQQIQQQIQMQLHQQQAQMQMQHPPHILHPIQATIPMAPINAANENELQLPNTVEELTKEIRSAQVRIEELKKRQSHLMICNQLLQNPAQLQEEAKRLEQTVLSLKDMQTMADEKMKNLVTCLDFEFNS